MTADGELFRNEDLTLRLEHGGRVVRVTRSATPFPSPQEAEQSYEPVFASLDRLGRGGRCLLYDQRQVVGRNDAAFESAFARIRNRVVPGFRKAGTLVASKVGLLHLRRLIREDGLERLASDSESEILEYFFDVQGS